MLQLRDPGHQQRDFLRGLPQLGVLLLDQFQLFGLGLPLEIPQRLHGPSILHDPEILFATALPSCWGSARHCLAPIRHYPR